MSVEELAAHDLAALDGAWMPWSLVEDLWHACPAHVWERFDWTTGRGHAERITRCAVCGAPRCDSVRPAGGAERVPMTELETQAFRCTLERHHDGKHDYLLVPPRVVARLRGEPVGA